ncbi:glucokinase [Methylomarinovum tepidoasis]|uniref:Glucokinase n=1 Tax=Methylomarinovum tepidoasis TaxID=2840183 RepID=A0AAU9CMC5_9GAMM|nr:glucokinase [Methylomarinovum sp. IN45]BCX88777.1 glucokinase [Methylomarinovum sp. IN45]
MMRLLAGDIGGTKTWLCLAEVAGGRVRVIARERFPSGDFERFEAVLARFRARWPVPVDAACFGVAGPVKDGVCRTTNLPWVLDAAVLSRQLDGALVALLNDLEAAAHGILELPPAQFTALNPRARERADAHRAVIAAGTGLGEALLIRSGDGVTVVATEGGHCDFAPRDAREDALLAWLRRSYPDHVSYERVVSGPGLAALYRFLREQEPARESAQVAAAMTTADPAAVVSRGALEWGDPLCLEALRWFATLYGAEAGNLALKSLAFGGIYIAGGIAPKILPVLRQGHFVAGFTAKGRYRELLAEVPLQVVLFAEVVLLGALAWGCHRLLGVGKVAVYNALRESE